MAAAPSRPEDEGFATVLDLYERGRYLDALEAGRAVGPLDAWPPVEPRILAGRLAMRLGAARLASRLIERTFRAHRDHPLAQYYHIAHVQERRGAYAAWQERRRWGEPPAGADGLADYHGQCAGLLAALRDFPAAEDHLRRGREAAPQRLYWNVERTHLFMVEDRFPEALDAAEAGLAAGRCYPPTILMAAHLYMATGRHEDALALLRPAADAMQSGEIASMLLRVLLRVRLLDEAEEALRREESVTPIREPDLVSLIASQRAELALHRRDYVAALGFLSHVTHPFHAAIATNLRACVDRAGDAAPRHVELPVPFVPQHHRTCVPAVLTAISRFWDRPAEHLAVAEEICYDGTPAFSERRWAQSHGWATREFRVDWDSAVALLDRGAPFTLTMIGAVAGHEVAVIGYDEATGVLLTRDPATVGTAEIYAAGLLAQQRASGPRGMAMVPQEKASLLDDLDLPEADLYDLYHALQLALDAHRRDGAVELRERMAAAAPDHRLTLTARRALARYDDNPHLERNAIEVLLERYPDDQPLQLARLQSLRQLADREERLGWLADVALRPAADPVLMVEYAVELSEDERQLDQARWVLRRALRRRHDDPYALFRLGQVRWRAGDQAGAAELLRAATCLDEIRDQYARAYFEVTRWLGYPETGLAHLRQRVERLGVRSSEPARTLFAALELLDRIPEALALLRDALRDHPDDGELRLFAAGRCAQYGRPDEAAEHRAAAAGKVKQVAWLAAVARDARLRGDRRRALECWREILETQPLDLEAHGAVARLLSEGGTRRDAVEHLRSRCAAFPHHAGLHRMLYQWTEGDAAAEREPVLRALAAIDPVDAWTARELALNLLAQNRTAAALEAAEAALALESGAPGGHLVLGHILRALGRAPEAEACFRRAIARSADAVPGIFGLLDTCGETLERRKEALEFVAAQLREQTVFGDGLLAFRHAARGVLTPAELLEALRRVHATRPDLWHAWSALVQHLTEMGAATEALELARTATERFPTVVPLRLDLARVHRARLEPAERVSVLERCRDFEPEATGPIVELADAYVQAGREPDAERLLEDSARRLPLAVPLRGKLAALLFQRGEQGRALDTLQEALRIEPGYEWAWQRLSEWSSVRGRTTSALDLAGSFAESRAGESEPWVRLGNMQLDAQRYADAVESANRALRAGPRNVLAHDLRAAALAGLRRFPEAEAACRPPELGDPPPPELLARAAWVDAQRGDVSAALSRMRALLARYPDFQWAWFRVMEWSAAAGRVHDALDAAERLSWLDPGNVVSLGWQGELKLRLADREGAKAAFRRAMQLQPDYAFAGFSYFDLQLGGGDLDGARRTLEILRAHAAPDRIREAEAALAAVTQDCATSLALVKELAGKVEADGAAVESAAERIRAAGWSIQLERTLRDLAAGPAWHPLVPVLWARTRALRGASIVLRLRWLAGLGAPGRNAVCAVLDVLGDRGKGPYGRYAAVRWRITWELLWIRLICRAFRADDLYWGKYGYALLGSGRPQALIRWMRDWRARRNVEPWMLQNLAFALLRRRKDEEARAVLRHIAHEVFPAAQVNTPAMLWSSLAACLDGDPALAERLLYATPEDAVDEVARPLRKFAVAYADLLRDPPVRSSLTPERRARLEYALTCTTPGSPDARLLLLATYHIGRRTHHRWMPLTSWVRLHWPGRELWWLGAGLLGLWLLYQASLG